MHLLRFLSLMMVAVVYGQGTLIPYPVFTEETVRRYNFGSCHKNVLEELCSYRKMREYCIDVAANEAGIEKLLDDNIVPDDIEDLHHYLTNFAKCKLEFSLAMEDDHVDFDAYMEFLNLPDPDTLETSRKRELEHLKDALGKCREESFGDTPVDVMLNFDRCIEIKYRDYCEAGDTQIGVKNDMKLSFLSFNTPSECPSVRIPKKDFEKWLDCIDIVAADYDGTAAGYDIRKLLPDTDACFYEAVGYPGNIVGYMNSLKGWDDIPQKREEINNAITFCDKANDPDTEVEFDRLDDGFDGVRESMARQAMYTDCLSPKINRICGMNSDVAFILEPPLNWRVRDKVFSTIKEKTGRLPFKLIGVLKLALFEP